MKSYQKKVKFFLPFPKLERMYVRIFPSSAIFTEQIMKLLLKYLRTLSMTIEHRACSGFLDATKMISSPCTVPK